MHIDELEYLFRTAGKRTVTIANGSVVCLAGLDLEGRLYWGPPSHLLSRVNPEAIARRAGRGSFVNPGGDGLWPAPEGTCFGFQYATGAWRVPPGLTNARFEAVNRTSDAVTIEAEIDLINAQGTGLPLLFRRAVRLEERAVIVSDEIEYLGSHTLDAKDFLLAPWSLCQFDAPEGTFACFADAGTVRDLYGDSSNCRRVENAVVTAMPSSEKRWQLALGPEFDAIELHRNDCIIRRTAAMPTQGTIADIADSAVTEKPGQSVRFSIYSDPSHFMEIEAVGPCATPLRQGTILKLEHRTEFTLL